MNRSALGWIAITATAIALASIFTIDEPVARWVATHDLAPAFWDRAISVIEYACGIEPWVWLGIAVLVAGVIVTQLVPGWHAHASAWLLVASTHLVARNLVFWIKTLTARLRPTEWTSGGTFFRDDGVAFPSGHVVLIASLVLPIAVAFPRTRALVALVPFVMVARVAVDAHFVSDVVGGLALAAASAWLCMRVIDRLPRAA